MSAPSRIRKLRLVPEVVQTSAMDCGPAALKSLLDGVGVPVSYGRLREACQTDVDGTSINALEDVANQLGVDAEQMLVPIDHLLLPETGALPAIVVVRLPSGLNHFVVVWDCHGPLVQVMDPASGRRWPARDRLLTDVYAHSMQMPADVWREWACADDFLKPLGRRLGGLGVSESGAAYIRHAVESPGWRALATLDAVTRLIESMLRSGSIRAGTGAVRLLDHLLEQCRAVEPGASDIVTPPYWTVLPAPAGPDGEERLHVRGAVLVRARGLRPRSAEEESQLSPELQAALTEPPLRLGREFLRLLREDGVFAPLAVVTTLVLVALCSGLEALLFRSLFELGSWLGLVQQRLAGMGLLALLLVGILLMELASAAGLFRLGRHLDTRLRLAFLRKVPLLGDRYFQSRPISDMAERGHSLYLLHLLLRLSGQLLRAGVDALVITAGIAWLHPRGAGTALIVCVLIVLIPLLAQPALVEQDLRVRVHGGALGRFYLDALLGLVPVRAHGAERSVRHEHESLLVEWVWAGRKLLRTVLLFEGTQALLSYALVIWLVHGYFASGGDSEGVLLLAFWAIRLVSSGQEMALLSRQYPYYRNIAMRLLEPLGALTDEAPRESPAPAGTPGLEVGARAGTGMTLALRGVRVVAAGHTVLDGIELSVAPGEHVAIVGPSGAGKSSLVGVFLGWHRAAAGEVLVDGAPLKEARLQRVRRETAWVDPAVHLWNRTLMGNLVYAREDESLEGIGQVLKEADLLGVLENLPVGLQTVLGEGGGLVSGGEGQRVRFGRALLQQQARLVILDEAFRGLDRQKRSEMLARARRVWSRSTLLCITHDVGDTAGFERVIVIEGGRIVEDGSPAVLAARPGSRYGALLEAEDMVRTRLWAGAGWRRMRVERGGGVEP